jgi:hypothetical protein
LVDKDRQQDPPSLPLARPEQELRHWLLIKSCFNAGYEVLFLDLNKLHFIHPFTLILVGLVTFLSLGLLQDRTISHNR